MEKGNKAKKTLLIEWLARLAVAIVFVVNVKCAFQFLINPEGSMGSFELFGEVGMATIRGIAVTFLMWNATYPLVILNPLRHHVLFAVVLAQQLIGLIGESYILFTIGVEHVLLREAILRFIAFDGFGLVIMALTYIVLMVHRARLKCQPQANKQLID